MLKFSAFAAMVTVANAQGVSNVIDTQIVITPEMVSPGKQASGLFDEQGIGENPFMLAAKTEWNSGTKAPQEFIVDLGSERHISRIMFWDLNGRADVIVSAGTPGNWSEMLTEDGVGYKTWKPHEDLDTKTRYLHVKKLSDGGAFSEMLVYEYTPEGAIAISAAKQEAAEREAMISTALAEKDKRPSVDTGTLFGELPLVDEIVTATDSNHTFKELPEGISVVESILGEKARVLPNVGDGVKYFAYKIGEGKYLEPGKAYLLTVEFPDDKPRSFHIANRGADMTRGIQTGQALGDTIFTYTSTNLESLNVPLSQEYMTFQQLFWLNDTFDGIKQARGASEDRTFSPVGGFFVVIGQPGAKQAPLSAGAAISKIRLFEVPDPDAFAVNLRLPEGLPQRHLFYREEMADGVINSKEQAERSVDNPADWYEYHMRLMNFLGMNTFSKDLLEFGSVQHWDVENPSWYVPHKFPHLWDEIVTTANEHNLNVLPYYEYGGSTGKQGMAKHALENKLVMPLKNKNYTHVKWVENKRADLTDPAVLKEFKHMLDLTIGKHKDKAEFVGVWLRPRVSQMPMSFSDATLERFTSQTGRDPMVRKDLAEDPEALDAYYTWWFGKRKEFLTALQGHLKEMGVGVDGDPTVLFMAVPSEPVPTFRIKGQNRPVVTDDVALWEDVATRHEDYDTFRVIDVEEVPQSQMYLEAIINPYKTWGSWEWHHGAPQSDPQNYKDVEGVMMVYPYNRKFTVNDPDALDYFRNDSGLAMVRHFPLNENTLDHVTGYFVADFERAGPYQMLPEALAVANGDPWYLGYTAGHTFNRAFPEYARRFNANYLALPALPSEVVDDAASEDDVVVRKIETDGKGTYVAIVNTGLEPLKDVKVKLPETGYVVAAATGNVVSQNASSITLDLDPAELKSIHIQ
ncbi:hypothetical protein [Rubellicoccus peritrichatus]|uniref:F5/8 type C domain-containing protein n=1 Tax=Rubellicoccus peritrichatus TaxID=3080537 RepID=A0AAQ3QX37_9BACT|nr:hypothetical protein [Puniceicoccus sp. CR14]WOO43278.1 hypothetical protein RZN69_09265 [Puniceicoccus sp. CR14]